MHTMFYQDFPVFDLKITFSATHICGVRFLYKNVNDNHEYPNLDLDVYSNDLKTQVHDIAPDVVRVHGVAHHFRLFPTCSSIINQDSTHNNISTINLAALIKQQLDNYRTNPKFAFSVPLWITGSVFQQQVWSALNNIKSGQTVSYGQIAKIINTSPRAVGNACGKNLIPLFIPCHRVISATGTLGGFMQAKNGYNLTIKQWLLDHEKA